MGYCALCHYQTASPPDVPFGVETHESYLHDQVYEHAFKECFGSCLVSAPPVRRYTLYKEGYTASN